LSKTEPVLNGSLALLEREDFDAWKKKKESEQINDQRQFQIALFWFMSLHFSAKYVSCRSDTEGISCRRWEGRVFTKRAQRFMTLLKTDRNKCLAQATAQQAVQAANQLTELLHTKCLLYGCSIWLLLSSL
jgi:hypothetical protein